MRRYIVPAIARWGKSLSKTRFWQLYQSLRSSDCAAQEEGIRHSVTNAKALLKHSWIHVARWRRIDDGSSSSFEANQEIADCWKTLPLTTKEDLRVGFPDEVTSSKKGDDWRYGSSAGTVDRVTIVTDFQKRDYIRAVTLLMVDAVLGNPLAARIVEIPPDACNVVCALRDEGPLELVPFLFWALRKRILFKRETLPDIRGRIERSLIIRQDTLEPLAPSSFQELIPQLDAHLDRIQKLGPNILRGLPLFLLWLAERASQRQLAFPTIKAIMPYGGLMGDAMADRISAAFSAPFIDFYGTSEFGGIAMDREACQMVSKKPPYSVERRSVKVFDELMLVEILDEHNQPLGPGKIGKVVVTDYFNYAMPLIRYEIGDYGIWFSENKDCNDPFELSREARMQIVGRASEMHRLADGRWVTARQMMNVLYADPAILNACVEYHSKRNTFTATTSGVGEVDPSTLQKLGELLEASSQIAHRRTAYLRPESSGKYCVYKKR